MEEIPLKDHSEQLQWKDLHLYNEDRLKVAS